MTLMRTARAASLHGILGPGNDFDHRVGNGTGPIMSPPHGSPWDSKFYAFGVANP